MAGNHSSPKRRTKKAGTLRRSTTSSTTDKTRAPAAADETPPTNDDAALRSDDTQLETPTPSDLPGVYPPLTAAERAAVLGWLLKGASPAAACKQLGVSVFSFERSCREDAAFRRDVGRIPVILSQNVAAALYRKAMEGDAQAQNVWLRTLLEGGWTGRTDDPPAAGDKPRTFDEFFDRLSDHELIQLARTMGIDVPTEIEGTAGDASGADESGRVPP